MRVIISLATFLLIALISGCSTTPKQVDVKSIPMPKEVSVQRTPGSLWTGENSKNRLFADFRARDVGDIITVSISENTEAKNEATTATSRTTSEDASISTLFGMPLDFNTKIMGQPFSPTVKGGHTNSLDGSGSTERKGKIKATIAVRVTEVLPNGNLFVEGKKDIVVNKERQYILLSGIVRPEDISPDNTISSDNISDLVIELSGYGVINDKQNPGWMTRVLDVIWPF